MFKRVVKKAFYQLRELVFLLSKRKLYVLQDASRPISDVKLNTIIERLKFFGIKRNVYLVSKLLPTHFLDASIISLSDRRRAKFGGLFKLKNDLIFNFDYEANFMDGWEYHRLLRMVNDRLNATAVRDGQQLLEAISIALKKQYNKAYLFGTGPSLERAVDHVWTDGIRIVSNTVVRDKVLWKQLNPHFIVAGDAIYHFGNSKFAMAFREDLKSRLTETATYFVFPAIFYSFCKIEFSEFKDRLIPIPQNPEVSSIHHDLTKMYCLPNLSNVLPHLLLPLGCTVSKDIFLWGFDGRAPGDKLFWKNSSRHFYSEYVDELKEMHPAFFKVLVPEKKEDSYVKAVHGEVLDTVLADAEKDGYKFCMMHFSYTETLMKRWQKGE
jgi:hypothetical protein